MINYPRTIRNFNAFVDGIGYAGIATEGKLPDLKLNEADHRGGGMDGIVAIDMGMEKMQATVTVAEWRPELITLFGTRRQMTLRPGELGEDNYDAVPMVATMRGRWSSDEFNDLKPGSEVPLKLTVSVDYFRFVHNGIELFEIDVRAGKRVIGGVDQMASMRAAMGF
ncbi:phage major tail tube protein [Pseudaestuariivita sp.]|uniref:phage major tail tube protein n=1 Tax=Pseudaestuariivita sp. TaxID=2211669 RepID=UPI004059CC30